MLATACAVGPRPSFQAELPNDDPAIAQVLERLDRAGFVKFVATYDIDPSSVNSPQRQATVRQLDGRRRVTIGDIEFATDGETAQTCVRGTCVDFIDDARVSDLNLTHLFWGSSFRSRLELDSARNLADGHGSIETIAGRPSVCVELPVIGGNVSYCALDAGILARYFGADVSIELTSFSLNVDEDDLQIPVNS
jgi:hypothetical protein